MSYCHARGVKVYLAVNTLMLDGELPEALKLVEDVCALPVDAVLVQDMGLAGELLSRAPKLRLHASTQTGVHTIAGAEALYHAGFKRVVLARELSLKEISDIHRECPIELEIFVHGALCMSVSGQCYFSSVFGSRSGNRGLCAQPCRLPAIDFPVEMRSPCIPAGPEYLFMSVFLIKYRLSAEKKEAAKRE